MQLNSDYIEAFVDTIHTIHLNTLLCSSSGYFIEIDCRIPYKNLHMTGKLYKIEFRIGRSDCFVIHRSIELLQIFANELLEDHSSELSEKSSRFLHVILDRPSLEFEVSASSDAISTIHTSEELEMALDAQRLHSLLTECLMHSNIIRGSCFSNFLWESSSSSGDSSEVTSIHTATALDFLLQPFDRLNFYIPSRKDQFYDFDLQKGSSLVWRFHVAGGYDVGFSVHFKEYRVYKTKRISEPTTILSGDLEGAFDFDDSDSEEQMIVNTATNAPPSPVSFQKGGYVPARKLLIEQATKTLDQYMIEKQLPIAGKESSFVASKDLSSIENASNGWVEEVIPLRRERTSPPAGPAYVEGSYTATDGGLIRICFDNSYSVFNGKHIELSVQVVSASIMEVTVVHTLCVSPLYGASIHRIA